MLLVWLFGILKQIYYYSVVFEFLQMVQKLCTKNRPCHWKIKQCCINSKESKHDCLLSLFLSLKKFFCSGKIKPSELLPKSMKLSNQVVYLYCHPFIELMGPGDNPEGRNVFWTKHDLGLKFSESEKGYALTNCVQVRCMYTCEHIINTIKRLY